MLRPRIRFWATLRPYSRAIYLWAIIALMIAFGIWLGVDKKILGVIVAIFGIATQAFSSLLMLLGLIPIAGPLLVKIFTLPFFWILNGLGYFLSIFAIRRARRSALSVLEIRRCIAGPPGPWWVRKIPLCTGVPLFSRDEAAWGYRCLNAIRS